MCSRHGKPEQDNEKFVAVSYHAAKALFREARRFVIAFIGILM
jgi:hypothetical protein